MIVSLNEIAATAAKAVRGGGHSVGMAEEMGFAARWLCQHELPGLEILLEALYESDEAGRVAVDVEDDADGGRRLVDSAGDRPVPALLVAPSLVELVVADGLHAVSVRVDALRHPLLVVPFFARAASSGADGLRLAWSTPDGPVLIEPSNRGPQIRSTKRSAVTSPNGGDVVVTPGPRPDAAGEPPIFLSADDLRSASERSIASGCSVDDAQWGRLGRLAWRTYVPVSAESRMRGAGAGLTDND